MNDYIIPITTQLLAVEQKHNEKNVKKTFKIIIYIK